MKSITLSPSDLSYFWKDSPRGFYDKYVGKIHRPRMPFPQVFNIIDAGMKNVFQDSYLDEIYPGLPRAKIANADRWVCSQPMVFPKYDLEIIIRGKVDSTLEFEDGTYGVVDFKATNLDSAKLKELYKWQLHAYAYALMKNNSKELHIDHISTLGLIAYRPADMHIIDKQIANLSGTFEWIPIEVDKIGFGKFITHTLLPILTLENPPDPQTNDDISWNKYLLSFLIEEEN